MPRPRTARDYEDDVTAASRLGLAELMTVLGGQKFRDARAEGPTWVAVFLSEGDPDADEKIRMDAFMTV